MYDGRLLAWLMCVLCRMLLDYETYAKEWSMIGTSLPSDYSYDAMTEVVRATPLNIV